MRPLWMSYFLSDEALIDFHYHDYRHALSLASDYSTQVAKDAYASGSDNYKVSDRSKGFGREVCGSSWINADLCLAN